MKPLIGITGDIEERDGKTYLYIDLRYGRLVEETGGIPIVVHPAESIKEILTGIDGLLLSGGEDIHPGYYGEEAVHPMTLSPDLRTEFEMALFKEALRKRVPILGVCHGMQLINVALGGSLYQDIGSQVPGAQEHRLKDKRHPVYIAEGSRLFEIMGEKEISVTSTHHQGVKGLGKGLKVSATARDGITEALEMPEYPFLIGVQWHPEKDTGLEPGKLFSAFVKRCSKPSSP